MLELDHLVIIAPDLDTGTEQVASQLGLPLTEGGKHREMGTHNRLLRLGDDVFLEVISIDSGAAGPQRPRWFGFSYPQDWQTAWNAGRCLQTWVARTSDMQTVSNRFGGLVGQPVQISRGDLHWPFTLHADGRLREEGAIPPVIDWGQFGNPARHMPDIGARLIGFQIEHPDPDGLRALLAPMAIANGPEIVAGDGVRLTARIETPDGIRTLA